MTTFEASAASCETPHGPQRCALPSSSARCTAITATSGVIAPSLADKLVRERERDRGLERATERDGGAVGDVVRDGIAKAHELAGGWGAQGQGPLARSAPNAGHFPV